MKHSKIAFLLIVLFFSISVFAGPFGLGMGMSLKDIGGSSMRIADGTYIFKELPKSNGGFTFYILQIDSEGGLYAISASGNPVETTPDGKQLKNEFDAMVKSLESDYGKCFMVDMLSPESTFDKSEDWMKGLLEGERFYVAKWSKEVKGSTLPNDLESIAVAVSATTQSIGSIVIQYNFTNSELYDTEDYDDEEEEDENEWF